MKTFWPLLLLLGCAGFSSAPRQVLDPKQLYRQDIQLVVNGIKGDGVMVVPQADVYSIQGTSHGALDLLTITTCHRDVSSSPGGTRFAYEYNPRKSLEGNGACPLLVGAYDKKGQHGWAIVEFEDDTATLPSFLACNGVGRRFNGVSICQSRHGLTQMIEFDAPVKVSPDFGCPMSAAKEDGKRFEFPIVKGTCVYAFKDVSSGKIHRLLTYGYESILLRED